jgi:hypothetical protein
VIAAYVAAEGDMNIVVDSVMLAESEDIGRFVHSYVLPAIQRGDVPRFPMLAKFEKRRVISGKSRKQQTENASGNTQDSLVAMIQSRRSAQTALVVGMEAKYGGTKGKKGKREAEPSEEEFARIQAEMEARRLSKKK